MTWVKASLACASVFLYGPLVAGPTDVPGYPSEGHWPYGPSYTAETWADGSDELLFYGEGTVMRIADVSDPNNMNLIGEVNTGNPVWQIDISGNGQLAAIADRNQYVSLVSIANPSAPVLLGQYEVESDRLPYATAFGPPGSNLLYVAIAPLGMYVLDISNPGAPTRIGTYEDPGTDFVFDIEVLGNYAFLADDVEGVTAVNVSNPAAPVFSADFPAATGASHITLDGNTAYVSRASGGTHIIELDVSGSPAGMTSLGVISAASSPQGSGTFNRTEVVPNGRVAIADSNFDNGVLIYDVSAPATPVYLDRFPSSISYVSALGSTIFASSPAGFGVPQVRAIDVDLALNPNAPEQIDELFTFSHSLDVDIDGNLVTVANDGAGVAIIDASDIGQPITRAWIPLGNQSAKSVAKVGNTLVVATSGTSLQVINISNLDNPVMLNPYPLGGQGFEVQPIPGTSRVLVAAGDAGVKILDFSNPNSPTVYSEWAPSAGTILNVAIDNNIVAVACDGDIWAVDFSNPASPVEKDTAVLPQTVRDIDIQGNYIYVAVGTDGFRVWDHVTGGVLSETGFLILAMGTVDGVKVRGNTAYVAAGTRYGMLLVDVSNPAAPTQTQSLATPGEATKLDISNTLLALSDLDSGVRLWGQPPAPSDTIFEDGFESP